MIDLESGELLRTLPYRLPWAFEDSGAHTIGFDDQGRVTIAITAISGNPFLSVDHVDVETGVCEASVEVWRQRYQLFAAAAVESCRRTVSRRRRRRSRASSSIRLAVVCCCGAKALRC